MRKSLRVRRALAAVTLTAASLTLAASTVAVSGPATASTHAPSAPKFRPACRAAMTFQIAACMALIRTDIKQRTESFFHGKPPVGFGYGRPALVSAYRLPSLKAVRSIAVVDAYNDPKVASDLATYRSAWRLPPCDRRTKAGCLTVTNEFGSTRSLPPNAGKTGWATEESLDVDMVAAICPSCHIFLVEAENTRIASISRAVFSAIRTLGVKFVSNSYGISESSLETFYDSVYKQPGVAVTASAGNSGPGVIYPAASQWVTSVGGTTLKKGGGKRGWTETVWGGTGFGCSKFEPRPAVQHGSAWLPFKSCQHRIDNDVAAVADPLTGVAVYDTYDQHGWLEAGGTGASAPIIAGVYALAGVPKAGTFPQRYPYSHPAGINDIPKARRGACSRCEVVVPVYQEPTGCGTPNGASAFRFNATQIGRRRNSRMPGPPCCAAPATGTS